MIDTPFESVPVSLESMDKAKRALFDPVSTEMLQLSSIRKGVIPPPRRSSFEKPGFFKARGRSKSYAGVTQTASPPLRSRRKRKVTFEKTRRLASYYDAPYEHSQVFVEDLWFTQLDFQRFVKTAQQEARTIRLAEEELLKGVEQSHAIAIRLAESVNKNAQDERLSMKVYNRLDMRNSGLADWCLEPECRGLERLASKQLRHAKHYIRKELRSLVLCKEDEDGGTNWITSSRSALKQQSGADQLAVQYQTVARESRLFARMMGLADELAAKNVYASSCTPGDDKDYENI